MTARTFKERLKLKRRDLAVELHCIVCPYSVILPVDTVLIAGSMPSCPKCTAPLYVVRAKAKEGVA